MRLEVRQLLVSVFARRAADEAHDESSSTDAADGEHPFVPTGRRSTFEPSPLRLIQSPITRAQNISGNTSATSRRC